MTNKMLSKKQLTNNSWLLMKTGGKIYGLLYETPEELCCISPDTREVFKNWDHMEKCLGAVETHDTVDPHVAIGELGGYPVKHENIVPDLEETDLPIYSKGQNTRFVAGFWLIKINRAWGVTLCPKLETIATNESIGPLKTKLEALHQMKILNRKEDDDKKLQ